MLMLSFDSSDVNIPFLRLCQDTSNSIENNDFALSTKSNKIRNEKVEFIRNECCIIMAKKKKTIAVMQKRRRII